MRNTIYQRGLILLTAVTLLGTAAAAATAQTDPAPSGDIDAQVVGGRQVTRTYDGMVAVEYDSREFFRDDHLTCTGVMLDTGTPGWSEWGAMAAHCASNPPAAAARAGKPSIFGPPVPIPVEKKIYQVRAGSKDRTKVDPLPIAEIVVTPWWEWIPGGPEPVDPKPAADLLLFRLTAPIPMQGATIGSYEPRPGSPVVAAGFGRTSNKSAAAPTIANELTTTVLPPKDCAAADISRHDVCTANPGGFCPGDSGGPVYKPVGRRLEVVAVVSRGGTEECGVSPDASTGLAYLLPWITAVTRHKIRADLPLTPAQGGPITHPAGIKFSTTETIELPDRVPVR